MALTLDDVKLLIDTFATKDDLQKVKEEIRAEMVTKTEFNQALGKLDFIIGEIQTYRQEQTATSQRLNDVDDEVSSLKKRVKKIEDIDMTASHLK